MVAYLGMVGLAPRAVLCACLKMVFWWFRWTHTCSSLRLLLKSSNMIMPSAKISAFSLYFLPSKTCAGKDIRRLTPLHAGTSLLG